MIKRTSSSVRKIYNKIRKNAPSKLKELPEKYNIDYNIKPLGKGLLARIYEVDSGVVGKILQGENLHVPLHPNEAFPRILNEYALQELSFRLGLSVPKLYEIANVYDSSTEGNYPMIIMQKINGMLIEKFLLAENSTINSGEERKMAHELFIEEMMKASKYIQSGDYSDSGFNNAMWSPEEKKVYLIDCERWKFKALHKFQPILL